MVPEIPEQFRLPAPSTAPVYRLADLLSKQVSWAQDSWVLDERTGPTGSHKDRSFCFWISYQFWKGAEQLALSSSGNAALAAAHYCALAKIPLHAFVRADFPPERFQAYPLVSLHLSKTPKRDAVRFANERKIPLLRASADPLADEGYKTIALELIASQQSFREVFIPTSSGATVCGIAKGYKGRGVALPRLYAVQTTRVHPIAKTFDKTFVPETEHPARAITDRIAKRTREVVQYLQEAGGGGYVISSAETRAVATLFDPQRSPGNESLLAVAALARHRKTHPPTSTLCLFSS